MKKSLKQKIWYQLRWRLSNILVNIARKIYSQNPEIPMFWFDLIRDEMWSSVRKRDFKK